MPRDPRDDVLVWPASLNPPNCLIGPVLHSLSNAVFAYIHRNMVLKRLLFIVSEDWYFVSHRLHLAEEAIAAGMEVAVLCRIAAHRDRIESVGVKVIDWNLDRRSKNPIAETRAIACVRRTLLSFVPDVVHAVALKPTVYSAMVRRVAPSAGFVYALGGLGFAFTSKTLLARTLRPVIRCALSFAFGDPDARVILQNPDDLRTLQNAGVVNNEQVRLIRGAGVDTQRFSVSPEPENSELLVVLPARMLWDKGVREFVDVAREIRRRGHRACFALVGDRDQHNPACVPEAVLNDWQDEGVVQWWGRREDMPKVLAEAHIICFPSYREGLPKALLEAASCARPIVAFDVPGCRESVRHGKNGFLVSFGDVKGMAAAIELLILDTGMRQRMGSVGRQMVEQEFSQEFVARQTMDVWREVAA